MRKTPLAGSLFAATVAVLSWGAADELVELSGPILPEVLVLYAEEGTKFPATLAGERDLVDRAALTFPDLLSSCAARYGTITLEADGGVPLTAEALAANYDAVAHCAYEQHTSKPYWIPKLVDDVDICGSKLGPGWRLPTESDVSAFSDAELSALAALLSPIASDRTSMGSIYFSMRLYVRGDDGTLKQADLTPGVTGARVRALDLPAPCGTGGSCWTSHLETGLSLRCIRRAAVP